MCSLKGLEEGRDDAEGVKTGGKPTLQPRDRQTAKGYESQIAWTPEVGGKLLPYGC
jgi:hypothetical protein